MPVSDVGLLGVLELLLPLLDDDAALLVLFEKSLRDQIPAPDHCGDDSDYN